MVGCLCDNKMRKDMKRYVDMEYKTAIIKETMPAL